MLPDKHHKEIEIQDFSPFGYNISFFSSSIVPILNYVQYSRLRLVCFYLFISQVDFLLQFDITHPNAQFNIRRKLNFRIVEFKWEKSWEIIWIFEHAMYYPGKPELTFLFYNQVFYTNIHQFYVQIGICINIIKTSNSAILINRIA